MGQAVVDVVVDQDALGRRHRAFHRRELAGDVEAGFSPSIIPMTCRRCPSARLSRFTRSGWVVCFSMSSMLKSYPQGILPLDVRSTAACQAGEWSPSQAKAIARSGIPAVVRREHKCVQQFTRKHVHVLYFCHSQRPSFPRPHVPIPRT